MESFLHLSMKFKIRLQAAMWAGLLHLGISILVACATAVLVLGVWFPYPYREMAGGQHLFWLLVGVDAICGPLLTLVIFDPRKSRRELVLDMTLVACVQLGALAYGLYTAYVARPLFLVHEVDRFRIISLADFGNASVDADIANLSTSLRPHSLKGPVAVGIREAKSSKERQDVMLESVLGGRDYAQRPEFYLPYDTSYASKALARARPLKAFVAHYPATANTVEAILRTRDVDMAHALFLPVVSKQDWIAILDSSADILGFVPGDGFDVPSEVK